jgi:site-specific DNA-methyltransferase (adenine-specific)/modification methylase
MSRVETLADGVTLYLGDCREILPTLGRVDAVVTDPPYGVKERTMRKSAGRGFNRHDLGKNVGSRDWPAVYGDDQPFDPAPWIKFPKVVLFGANHFAGKLPDASQWIIWDKRENTPSDDNADCEIAWTNLGGPARIHRQLWRGICRRGEENIATGAPTRRRPARLHPTQKPIALMTFCLQACRLPTGATVLDPYMGAGATGVAAVRMGLQFIGIEIEPEYFSIACHRIDDALRRPNLFIERPKPAEQLRLDDYQPRDDLAKSIDACYEAVRERQAAGGPGWEPK